MAQGSELCSDLFVERAHRWAHLSSLDSVPSASADTDGRRHERLVRCAVRAQDDLARVPRLEQRERSLELVERQLLGDQRPQVDDAVLEQPAGLVPGGEDLAAAHGGHVEVLEDQLLGDVELHRLRRDSEQDHAAAVAGDAECVDDRLTRAGHLEHDVGVLALVVLDEPGGRVGDVAQVEDLVRAHALGETEPERRPVRREHAAGARGTRDADAEQADGAAAEDRHRLAGDVLVAEREHRVPERLLERCDLRRQLRAVVLPDHRLRHGDVLGEGAVAVDAEDLRLLAHVGAPGAAVVARAAGDVALGGDVVAGIDVAHTAADLHDGPGELVPERQRRRDPVAGPGVPAEDVEIGPAHACRLDLDEHLVVGGRRHGHLLQREPRRGSALADRPHGLHTATMRGRAGRDIRGRTEPRCGFPVREVWFGL